MYQYRNTHTTTLELSTKVLADATALGVEYERKRVENGYQNVQGQNWTPEQSLAYRVSGYCGEAAVALYLGLTPKKVDHFQDKPDIGGYDVMTTKRPNGCLIFTPKNPLYSVKILVIDESPFFHLVGCYQCCDAREHKEWWREPRPGGGAWFVPQDVLRPINSGDDVRPIDEQQKRTLDKFAGDWRETLENAGVKPPNTSPFGRAIFDRRVVDEMGKEPYGAKPSLRNPGGNVAYVAGLDPKLATYHERKEP